MMEFTFEASPWEQALEALQPGETINLLTLLSYLEEEDEDTVLEALDMLEEKGVALGIDDLPNLPTGGNMALRLREEKQLVESGRLLTGLPENDPLRLYLEELAATPAAGDTELLAQQYLDGDENAAQKLVTLSLSRVVELASALAGKNVLLLDLIQEGSMGLWQGILNYTGDSFDAHRDWWICQYLHRAVFMQARSGEMGQKLRQGMEDYRDVDQKLLAELGRTLKTPEKDLISRVEQLGAQNKELEKEIAQLHAAASKNQVDGLLDNVKEVNGVKLLACEVEAADMNSLRDMSDMFRDKLGSGVVVLGAKSESGVNLIVAATKDLTKQGIHAGNIIKEIAKVTGGGGGGRPDMAQAGGKDYTKLAEALAMAETLVAGQLK